MEILIITIGLASLFFGWKIHADTLSFSHFETLPDDLLPGLSVVIAARDEERTVERSLVSLLELDYPDLEVIFVNDRSTDRTEEIATKLALNHPRGERLKVINCRELPSGWLGKLHAQHIGVRASTQPLIVLTDADVVFSQESLKKAASAQRVLSADHLVVAPQIETRGFWEPALVSFFLLMFTVRFQPGTVHKKKERFVGIGAFNLLTRQALERCEFLEPLRLQIIDDMHLGRLVKSRDMNQFCVLGEDEIRVRWIEGLRGCVYGLEKNAYAGLDYNLAFSLVCAPLVCSPFWLPILLSSTGHGAWALAYLVFLGITGALLPAAFRLPRWVGLTFPLVSLVLAYTFLRSTWLAEIRGGISWRGTLYPLAQLRAAHREFVKKVAPL